MSSCSFVRGLHVNVRVQSVCIPRFSFYYRRRLYPGSPGRHPCFIAGSALLLQKFTGLELNEVLKRDSTGGLSSYYRCENLTTNYLTPLLSVCNVMHAIGSSYSTKVTCLFVEPLRPAVDVQLAHSLILLSWFVLSLLLGSYWWDARLEAK